MKIVFTGGGTGGHFYPLIAVAEKINAIADKEKIVGLKLYFMSHDPYDKELLFENSIAFLPVSTGKQRLYRSWKNITDLIAIGMGCLSATIKLFFLYPDVIFSKGGYGAFPALFAAKILRIPVVIHDSDSVPGRVSLWSAKFAKHVGISYPEASEYFPKEKTAWVGVPIRETLRELPTEGMYDILNLDPSTPTILVTGGSQGAQRINNILIDALPELLNKYQIIHQLGVENMKEAEARVSVVLEKHPFVKRYKPFSYLNELNLKMAAAASRLVISRAGSTIFELAQWGKPSIIIPLPQNISRDQSRNAFAYARNGACSVIEEENLTPSVLISQINALSDNQTRLAAMSQQAKAFAKPDAAEKIARDILDIALKHEE
jgi:UDP-N-acetylglucosamine--N-acetylmuramyl-(pentapeptide) pyrophosphoryl-undecaprenol N-acetylglucosamine transferase